MARRRFRRRGPKRRRIIRRRSRRMRGGRRRRGSRRVVGPATRIVKLRYVDVDTPFINSATATFASNTYKINSAFDVNQLVGTTHMPGFAEWANFYLKYKVMATKISTEITNPSNKPYIVQLRMEPDISAPLTWNNYMQMQGNPYCKTRSISQAGGLDKIHMSMYASLGRLLGNRLVYKTDTSYEAQTNANPARTMYGSITLLSAEPVTLIGTTGVYTRTTVTMWIKLWEPIRLFT